MIKENGQKVILHGNNRTQREAIAKQLLTPSTSFDHTYGTKTVRYFFTSFIELPLTLVRNICNTRVATRQRKQGIWTFFLRQAKLRKLCCNKFAVKVWRHRENILPVISSINKTLFNFTSTFSFVFYSFSQYVCINLSINNTY